MARRKTHIPARVEELIYLGDHIRARMSLCGTDDFIVKIPNSAEHSTCNEGTTAEVGWLAGWLRTNAVDQNNQSPRPDSELILNYRMNTHEINI